MTLRYILGSFHRCPLKAPMDISKVCIVYVVHPGMLPSMSLEGSSGHKVRGAMYMVPTGILVYMSLKGSSGCNVIYGTSWDPLPDVPLVCMPSLGSLWTDPRYPPCIAHVPGVCSTVSDTCRRHWPSFTTHTHSSVSVVINAVMYQRLIKPCDILPQPTKGKLTDTYRPGENMGSLYFYIYLVNSLIVIYPKDWTITRQHHTAIVKAESFVMHKSFRRSLITPPAIILLVPILTNETCRIRWKHFIMAITSAFASWRTRLTNDSDGFFLRRLACRTNNITRLVTVDCYFNAYWLNCWSHGPVVHYVISCNCTCAFLW